MDKRQADVVGLTEPALGGSHPLSQARRVTSVPPVIAAGFVLLVVGVVATWVMHAPAELAAIVVAGAVLAFAVELAGDRTWRRITARGRGFEVGAERQLAQEIERVAGELVDTGSTPVRMTEAAGSGDAVEQFREEEARRRRAVEKIITDSVAWGYNNSWLFASTPRPVIEWTDDGTPRIALGIAGRPAGGEQ